MASPGSSSNLVDPFLNQIANGKKTLKAAAARKGQKPVEKPSRFVLLQHQYMFLRSPKWDDKFKITTNIIFHEFPPCVVPFSTLGKVYYDDLRLEIAHRGSYLLLRSICPANRLISVTTIAEDEAGDVQMVQIYNQDGRRAPESIIPHGQVFIVKEPFFKTTVTGGTAIRVDHVSDVVFLDGEDERIPPAWQPRLRLLSRTASDWKEDGNACFKVQKYHEASQCYTKGLEIPDFDRDVEVSLKLNRAQAYLKLGYFEKAIQDADSVLEVDPLNLKGLYRSATALYEDGKFGVAKALLTTLLKTYPGNAEAKAVLLRTYRRLHEARTGEYDFAQLRSDAKRCGDGKCKLDFAEYVGPVEVRSAGAAAGRGLFTTQSVKAGQMLLCSKAFVFCTGAVGAETTYLINMVTERGQMGIYSQLGQELVQALYHNPRKAEEFLKLYSGNYKRVEEGEVDGKPIVDTHLAFRIMQLNGFGCNGLTPKGSIDSKGQQGCGIWIMPSYINHSCWPTVCRSFLGDMMMVRAARDLAAGEQLVFDYGKRDPTERFEDREKHLKRGWGFLCTCFLCLYERSQSRAVRDGRNALLDKIEAHRTVLKRSQEEMQAAIPIVRHLIRNLRATYTKPESSHPRMALEAPYILLEGLLVRTGRVSEGIALSKEWLASLGFRMKETRSPQCKVTIEKYGVLSRRAQFVLVQLSCGYGTLDDVAMAGAYRDVAADVYEIVYGEKPSFAETLRSAFDDAGVALE